MCRQAPLQFLPVRIGKLKRDSIVSDAVPNVFDELDALGHWKILDVFGDGAHGLSIAQSRQAEPRGAAAAVSTPACITALPGAV